MPGWRCEPIFRQMREARKAARVRYLRYVPDGDLAALYAGATVFALPSHYEGFGFPPLEAMACGTAVVSSAGGSLPEVLGDAALIVPSWQVADWVAALQPLLEDGARRAALAARGPAWASRYRWENTARETWEVYRRVAGRGGPA